LWPTAEITAQAVADYFNGGTVVQVERQGYQEPMPIPKVGQTAVEKAISAAVEGGNLWLRSGPASMLGEPVPPGVVNPSARLSAPPAVIVPAEILPENLPGPWQGGVASGLSVATALSVKMGKTLPWKTVRDSINAALQARFLEVAEGSQAWPCDLPSAQFVKFKVASGADRVETGWRGVADVAPGTILVAAADLQPAQVQDLGDIIPKLLEIRAKAGLPIRFHVRVEIGDGQTVPTKDIIQDFNALLQRIDKNLTLR